MHFSSDISFKGEEASLLIKVREYFEDRISLNEETDDSNPKNYKVFIFCTYLGFVVEDDSFDFNMMSETNHEKPFNIPKGVMGRYEMRMKELLICAKFFHEKFIVCDGDLQVAWNQEKFNEDEFLIKLIKEMTIKGARYFVKLMDSKIDKSIKQISDDINEKLEKLLIRIDGKKKEYEILSEGDGNA